MDLQMPVLDGYKTTEVIRNELNLVDIPIIAMTADALKGVEKQCLEVGMNDYVSKPIIPDILFKKLNKWVKRENDLDIISEVAVSPTVNTHLDIDQGINRVGDNKNLYLSLINKFYHNNLGLTAVISKLYHDKEEYELKRVIHTLKGVSGNISANILHRLCLDVEDLLKNDFPSTEATLIKINKELNTVLNEIKVILSKEENQSSVESEYSEQELEYLFERLIKLLNEDDIDALDFFEVILSKVKSQPFYNELSNLKGFVHNYEFEQAITELQLFFKKHNFLKGE
jgi:HPt (histidine-containing phosphotransfer) domain-containing protein